MELPPVLQKSSTLSQSHVGFTSHVSVEMQKFVQLLMEHLCKERSDSVSRQDIYK